MKSEKIFSRERKVLAAGIAVVLLANAAGLTLYILEKSQVTGKTRSIWNGVNSVRGIMRRS